MLLNESEQKSFTDSNKLLETIAEVFMSQFSEFEKNDISISLYNSISSSGSESAVTGCKSINQALAD